MGRPQYVGISEPLLKQRTGRRLPAIELPVKHIVVNKKLSSSDSKSPSMIYESFKGLKLTSRPTSQSNNARLWQEWHNQHDFHAGQAPTVDVQNIQDLALHFSGEQSTTGEHFHSDLDTTESQAVTFRFSFKTMDNSSQEDKENRSRSQGSRAGSRGQGSRAGSRFTSLETAADRENHKLGLLPVKITPLQSPRTIKGNPLESLSIGQPVQMNDTKTAKKRLLRKPLPLNHYKKSQKVRILQNSDVRGLVNVGQVSSSSDACDLNRHAKNNSGVYTSVSEWLNNIEGHEFDTVSSSGDPAEVEQLDEHLDNKKNSVDLEQSDQLSQELKSAEALQHKHDPTFIYSKSNTTLPDISDKFLRRNPKMREFQGRLSKLGEFEPIESDDEEYDAESSSQKSEDVHFPHITQHRDLPSSRSDTSSKVGESSDVKLPRLLLDGDSDESSDQLERQRLRLIHLEANAPDTVRSEPVYLPGQYMYTNKGASSQRYSKKHLSLKEMAASFQRKMTQSMEYPDDGKKLITDKLTRHTSVIDQSAYDHFARKNKPKPAMFSPGVTLNTATKLKQKELLFPRNCDKINGTIDAALELSYAKLNHTLRRDSSNVSMNSLSSKRNRSSSRDRLRRSNSMVSISSSCYGHVSRRDSSRGKDSGSTRHRRRGRSHSKNRSRTSRVEDDY